MKKIIVVLFTCILGIQAKSQSPFNYGQNEDIYFISAEDIDYYNIMLIHNYSMKYDDFTREAEYSICEKNFSQQKELVKDCLLTNRRDTFSNPPSLQDALDREYNYIDREDYHEYVEYIFNHGYINLGYVNGMGWYFKNNRATYIGGIGYGAICWEEYTMDTLDNREDKVDEVFSRVLSTCKYGEDDFLSKLFFNSDDLPLYEVYVEEEVKENRYGAEDYKDTTYFIYDDLMRFKGYIEKGDTINIIEKLAEPIKGTEYGWWKDDFIYINKKPFKAVIDKSLGCKPKLILMEIYKNAVFVFKYSEKLDRYIDIGQISLESYYDL